MIGRGKTLGREKRPEGTERWLDTKTYAKKYRVDLKTLAYWRSHGYIEFKPYVGKYGAGFLYPDLRPDDHPAHADKPQARCDMAIGRAKIPEEKAVSNERRKEILAPYLQMFLNDADPAKMYFRGAELMSLLGVLNARLYGTWQKWGLKSYPMPDAKLNEKVFSRSAVVEFLSYDYDKAPTSKALSTDEKIMKATLGATSGIGDGYYHYDKAKVYPMDGHGFLRWLEDKKIKVENKKLRRWVQFMPMPFQREFFIKALETKPDGSNRYGMIVACWERGEGKTLCVDLIVIFRFFNGFQEIINLASESKDQASFIHYNLIKKIILNNDSLKKTEGLEVKEKHIVLMAGKGDPFSIMKTVPTSSGLLPGTTLAAITELHKFKDRAFFVDLWSSTRATANAMTIIDTTVAKRGHIVHDLWDAFCAGKDELLYFNHKCDDIQNPENTPEKLNSFRQHMLPEEYNRYFRNRWDDAVGGLFSPRDIRQMGYAGIKTAEKTLYGPSDELTEALDQIIELEARRRLIKEQNVETASIDTEISKISQDLIKMDDIYNIPASTSDLQRLRDVFGVNFMIGVGLDRSKLLTLGKRPDRTVMVCLARGVINENESYIFLLDIFIPSVPTFHFLQDKIIEWSERYSWITKAAAEEFQAQDFQLWCVEHGIDAELMNPVYKNQELIFTDLYQVVHEGLFKAPTVPYYTDDAGTLFHGYSNKVDIFREEMDIFVHDDDKKVFGTPNKSKKGGTKDDVMFAVAWANYACKGDNIADLHAMEKERKGSKGSVVFVNPDVIGNY